MAHGYLGDGYGSHGEIDPDRDDDREAQGEACDEWRSRASATAGSCSATGTASRWTSNGCGDRERRGAFAARRLSRAGAASARTRTIIIAAGATVT